MGTKKVILPAAGYGHRVGSPPAKELLPHPRFGLPLIEQVLKNLESFELKSHVIVRKQKLELIDFLKKSSMNLSLQLVDATEEWPATVLLSQPHWADFNLLYLPDSEFEPLHIVPTLFEAIERVPCAFAGQKVLDPQHWGVVQRSEHHWQIAEKPQAAKSDAWAWGLIAFRREVGRELFLKILESHRRKQWQPLSFECLTYDLVSYRDLTRP